MDRYAKWDRNTGGAPTQVVSMAAHFTIGLLNEATQGMVEAPKDEQGRFIPGAHPFRNGTDTGIMNFLFGDATYLSDVPGYWIYQATGYNIRDKWFYEWMP